MDLNPEELRKYALEVAKKVSRPHSSIYIKKEKTEEITTPYQGGFLNLKTFYKKSTRTYFAEEECPIDGWIIDTYTRSDVSLPNPEYITSNAEYNIEKKHYVLSSNGSLKVVIFSDHYVEYEDQYYGTQTTQYDTGAGAVNMTFAEVTEGIEFKDIFLRNLYDKNSAYLLDVAHKHIREEFGGGLRYYEQNFPGFLKGFCSSEVAHLAGEYEYSKGRGLIEKLDALLK